MKVPFLYVLTYMLQLKLKRKKKQNQDKGTVKGYSESTVAWGGVS